MAVMVGLALVSEGKKGDNSPVKLILSILAVSFCALSCAPVNEHQAGRGAFDESPVGQALDANAPLPGDHVGGSGSFEEWKGRRE